MSAGQCSFQIKEIDLKYPVQMCLDHQIHWCIHDSQRGTPDGRWIVLFISLSILMLLKVSCCFHHQRELYSGKSVYQMSQTLYSILGYTGSSLF